MRVCEPFVLTLEHTEECDTLFGLFTLGDLAHFKLYGQETFKA